MRRSHIPIFLFLSVLSLLTLTKRVNASTYNDCFVSAPTLQVSPTSLDFGSVTAGTNKTLSVTVTYKALCINNPGAPTCGCNPPSSVTVQVQSNNPTVFAITGASSFVASNNVPVTVSIRFSPPTGRTDAYSGTMTFSPSSGSSKAVSLAGVGYVPQPNISLTPISFDFGNVALNTTKNQTLTIRNEGNATLTGTVAASGPPYSVSTSSFSISPGGSRNISVSFIPTSEGTATGTVTIRSNDPDNDQNGEELIVNLTGVGLKPLLYLSPSSVNFDTIPVGESLKRAVTISNGSCSTCPNPQNLILGGFSVSGSGFTFSGPGKSSLAPGESTTVEIIFTPTSGGPRWGTFHFTTNDPTNLNANISLNGNAVYSWIDPSTMNLSFGDVPLATTSTQTLSIKNKGSVSLTVSNFSSFSSRISVSPPSATISPGTAQNFSVSYRPTATVPGELQYESLWSPLQISSSDPALSVLSIDLSGRGVSSVFEPVNPLNFETLYVGDFRTDSLTLTNSDQGNKDLIVQNISSNRSSFTPLQTSLVIPPGESKTVSIKYSPLIEGSDQATITIVTSDSFNPVRTTTVSGNAVSQLDLSVSEIEATQAVQTLGNTISLVAGKNTTVRTFIASTIKGFPNQTHTIRNVDGVLQLYKNGTRIGNPLQSQNGPIAVVPSPDREKTEETLNFLIPGSLTSGEASDPVPFELVVEINPSSGARVPRQTENNYTNNRLEQTLNFSKRFRPDISAIPISYNFVSARCRGLPDQSLVSNGTAFLKKTYPLAGIDYQIRSPIAFNCDINGTCGGVLSYYRLFESLFIAGHLAGNAPDLIYGWFRCNPFSGNGAALIDGKVAFGNTDLLRYGRTFAHEVGHNLGLTHNLDSIDEVGFDPEAGEVRYVSPSPLSGGDHLLKDLMYAGLKTDQAWIETSNYRHFYKSMNPDDPFINHFSNFNFGGTDAPVLLVSGRVGNDNSGNLHPIYETFGPWNPPSEDVSTDYRIEVFASSGEKLSEYPIQAAVDFDTEESSLSDGQPFSVIIPNDEKISELQLIRGENVLSRITRSFHAPQIEIQKPVGGEKVSDKLFVSWTVVDEDQDKLSYSVLYRSDPDREFETLGVNLGSTSFEYPAALLAGGSSAIVRVVATDGFNTSAMESEPFEVVSKPPQLFIHSPEDGKTVFEGSGIALEAVAHDPEEGDLSKAISWKTDLSGEIAVGNQVAVTLPQGSHVLSATAEDSDGNRVSRSVKIYVVDGAHAPRANAGSDQFVDEGESVELDGSGSFDPDEGDNLTYEWFQTQGPDVVLDDPASSLPKFSSPQVNTETLLRFEMTVNDGNGNLGTDHVDVVVLNTFYPSLHLSVREIDFGIRAVGESGEQSFTLSNIGNETLEVVDLKPSRPVFSTSPRQMNLKPGESQEIVVKFVPDEEAAYESILEIESNTVAGVATTVVLKGSTPNPVTFYNDNTPGGSLSLDDDSNAPQTDVGPATSAGGCSLIIEKSSYFP